MTSAEYKQEIDALLRKATAAEKIASIQAATKFKDAATKAKKAKTQKALQDAYNQLKGFYQ